MISSFHWNDWFTGTTYADKNRVRQLCWQANSWIGCICRNYLLPALKGYWSVEEGLGIPLIQKVMTRVQVREIFQNVHFADTLQNLPPRDGKQCDRAWKLGPLFDHFQEFEAFPRSSAVQISIIEWLVHV